ncbi:hypothetical protein AB3R30_04865 [Leptolyngbyaceae cyanobacterium UHCC 1019]
MAHLNDWVLNALVPTVTNNLSMAAQAACDGTQTMLTSGAGLITQAKDVSKNPQSFGFAFEHLQAIGFNIKAAMQGSEARAYQVPPDGSTKFSPDIYVEKIGQIIVEIQAKVGSADYVERHANSGNYQDAILTNVENAGIENTTTVIEVEGIQGLTIPKSFAVWTANNPYSAATLIQATATSLEVVGAGVEVAVISTEIELLLQSIKIAGAYCRGEQDLAQAEVDKILKIAIASMQEGFVRGVAIKVIQKLTGSSAFASLGFTVSKEALPALVKVLQFEMTMQQAVTQVGLRSFTAAVIVPVILLCPEVGIALLSAKVIQSIWMEISPEWKVSFEQAIASSMQTAQVSFTETTQSVSLQPALLIESNL